MEKLFVYRCGCGKQLKVREAQLGKPGRCSRCDTAFVAQRGDVTLFLAPGVLSTHFGKETRIAESLSLEWHAGDVVLDTYEVLGVLGEGGMGKVYRVYHRGWNTEVAVKVPKPDVVRDAVGRGNFERECETWVNLGLHPNTVSCYFVRRMAGTPIVFAEYIRGGSLADWISSKRLYRGGHRKALARIFDIAIQFAWGLHYAHKHGLVHQDVKPANVMMTENRVVKVTDFGLAKARAMAGERRAAKGDSVVVSAGGMTPAYCSPEQASNGGLTRKTDIWSWAVSVMEMFTGSVTWMAGPAAASVLQQYLEERKAGDLPAHLPKMPGRVAALLMECFHTTPEKRPADLLTLAQHLQDAYLEKIGTMYPRQEPPMDPVIGDPLYIGSLNNRAVSMNELGSADTAYELLSEAEAAAKTFESAEPSPVLQEIAYNRTLMQLKTNALFRVEDIPDVIPQKPDKAKYAYFVGRLFLAAGSYDAAIKYLGFAVERDGEHRADSYNARGMALLLLGETRPAILSFREALARGDERSDIQRNLALAYYYDGDTVRALRIFEQLSGSHVLDAEDTMRYAAVLASAGCTSDARERIEQAIAEEERTPMVALTAAELCAGAQTFLPAVGAVPIANLQARSLVSEVLAKEPENLRAFIDHETYPERYALRPKVNVRWGERKFPEATGPTEYGDHLAASFRALTKQFRWGELPARSDGLQSLMIGAILPLLIALLLWPRIASAEQVEYWLGLNSPGVRWALWLIVWGGLFFTILRAAPRDRIWGEAVFTYIGFPVMLYLPTAAHRWFKTATDPDVSLTFFNVGHAAMLASLAGMLFISFIARESVFQRLAARVRAYGAIGKRAMTRPPDDEEEHENHPAADHTKTAYLGRVEESRAPRRDIPKIPLATLMVTRILSWPGRVGPALTRRLRLSALQFGPWQALLLPEFLLVAAADWWALQDRVSLPTDIVVGYGILMLAANLSLLAYAALIPRLFLWVNYGLAFIAAGNVCIAFLGSDWGAAEFGGFFALGCALAFLNWMAMENCPAFCPQWKTVRHERWDVDSLADPLNIRRFAAPWQLVRIDVDRREGAL